MGRRKINIKAITDKKIKYSTFNKRKNGLIRKAAELSMLCNVKLLLVFEDLNGDVLRYSTHGIYNAQDYFEAAWKNCEKSFTANDYPDFFKVKQYKKVLERREKLKELKEELSSQDADNAYEREEEKESKILPIETKTIKQKLATKPKARNSLKKPKLITTKENPNEKEQLRQKNGTTTQEQADMQNQAKIQTSRVLSTDLGNSLPENPFRTPQLLGMTDKPFPNMANLGNPEFALDMRSPGLNFLNEQFMRASMMGQRLPPLRDEFGVSPQFNPNSLLNEVQDNFTVPRNRKSSSDNYFQYLDDSNNIWRKLDTSSGLKLRSTQFPWISQGIGDLLNYSATGFPQRDMTPYTLENPLLDSFVFNQSNLESPDTTGPEPLKKVRRD